MSLTFASRSSEILVPYPGHHCQAIATSYAPQIEAFATAISPINGMKHLELNYGNTTSWGLSYNLLGDKLLGTGVFGQNVFEMRTHHLFFYVDEHDFQLVAN